MKSSLSLPPQLSAWQAPLRARWLAMPPRERRMVALALAVVLVFMIWLLAVQPAWRTLRDAPARLDMLDIQLQQMQRLAAESRELHDASPLSQAQSAAALKAATDRLGDKARLSIQGDRASLTLNGINGDQLKSWMSDARSGARARPVDAQLARGPQGYTGTLVVSLGGSAS